ncbi:MAG: N-acetylgalactosamine-6-sulfatase, partial [Acidobacteria bacterium]
FHHVEPPPSLLNGLYRDEEPIRQDGYVTDVITKEAEGFIDRQPANQPFFLYVAYTAPHSPFQGPGDLRPSPLPPGSELWNQDEAPKDVYRAMLECMDHGIGSVLKKLDDRQMTNDTIVLFMSDNGGTASGRNAPFSGHKGGVFEGGIRVPCIVRWPEVLRPGLTFDEPCITMDFSASMVRAAGAQPEPGRAFDGIDILKHLAERQPIAKRSLFWRARRAANTRKAVRDGSLKYIADHTGNRLNEYLFDVLQDPCEKTNLLSSRGPEVQRLKLLLKEWEESVKTKR